MISAKQLLNLTNVLYIRKEKAEYLYDKYDCNYICDKRFENYDRIGFLYCPDNIKNVPYYLILPLVTQFEVNKDIYIIRDNDCEQEFYFYFSWENKVQKILPEGYLLKSQINTSMLYEEEKDIWKFSIFNILNLLTINENEIIIHHPLGDIKFWNDKNLTGK